MPCKFRFFVVMVVLCPFIVLAQGDKRDSPVDIPYLDNIVIDGNGADWGTNGFAIDCMAGDGDSIKSVRDFNVKARIGWNKEGLLVLVTVDDDKFLEADNPGAIFQYDGIELFLGKDIGYAGSFQPLISPGLDPAHPQLRTYVWDNRGDQALIARRKPSFTAMRTKTATGYVAEAIIPWSNQELVAQEGTVFGFRINVNDVDDQNGRYQYTWTTVGKSYDGADYHYLRLAQKASQAVTVAAWATYDNLNHCVMNVIGPQSLSTKTFCVFNGKDSLTSGTFKRDSGRAIASVTFPLPQPGKEYGVLSIIQNGKTIFSAGLRPLSDVINENLHEAFFSYYRQNPKSQSNIRLLHPDFPRYVFTGSKFPPFNFQDTNFVKRLLGSYQFTIDFFNNQGQKTTAPETPGRYGARIRFSSPDANPLTLYKTLYYVSPETDLAKNPPSDLQGLEKICKISSTLLNKRPLIATVLSQDGWEACSKTESFAVELSAAADTAMDHKNLKPSLINTFWWHKVRKADGSAIRYEYAQSIPASYGKDPAKLWPLIIYLHGSYEGFFKNFREDVGILHLRKLDPERPYILVAPIAPMNPEDWSPPALKDLIDEVVQKYHIDKDRIYLTGFSMGGMGTWSMALAFPDLFAAIAPVAAGAGDSSQAQRISNLPCWVFNGENDPTLSVEQASKMVNGLKKVHGRVKFTVVPGAAHVQSRDITYAHDDIFDWLLQQKRGAPAQEKIQ